MDHGPSRRGHFGACDGSPPRVGCALPIAPTALRRRPSRSSDRGGGFVFGSSLGRPCEHDDCLARAGPPACWRRRSYEPPRAHLRVGLRLAQTTRSFGISPLGSTQHPSGCARVARGRARLRACVSAASGLTITYAGDRGRMGSTSSNHRSPLFGASAGSRTSLFGDASR